MCQDCNCGVNARKFQVLRVDHIGIAVKDMEQAKKFYTDVLGMAALGEEVIEQQKVKVCFIPCGDSEVELLESTSPDGPVAKFIEKNGEGIQHLALRVDNLEAALTDLKEQGVRLIDETPRYGAGGASIAFVHPKATGGILLELSERK
ncbi:Ethylmalonyl-CoA/methylmalonyl-CoA epimerase [Sporomusa silvacetica DSM 10669]|uniref:Ethylmalonyl-CoA/methylmalonyl-CoA epimerase n=1 Tax=Sporomusa silvacetica DSM 10669 TaxID=1123289 RepID=A0ABZ3IJH6_9FIRM|nr:methylmalonyl-CoA epimerase [Sporomusa silvacetica]OZC18775.1 lactoylglutathione lyase [Sporomusa silvacetica DSM 10669]